MKVELRPWNKDLESFDTNSSRIEIRPSAVYWIIIEKDI